MQPRMKNPALQVPGILEAVQAAGTSAQVAADAAGVPASTIALMEIRASQINGCAVCLDMHTRGAKRAGETEPRLHTVSAWRESPYFDDAERAALALTEAGTRLADKSDPIPEDLFALVAKHYDEQAAAALIVVIAVINAWNRLNVVSGQVAGEWTAQFA